LNIFFETSHLTLEQKRDLCHKAHAICSNWWADILDGLRRQKIECSFEEIMEQFDKQAMFSVIHRCNDLENYLEIGFRTMTNPDYFLWICVDPQYIDTLMN